MIYRPLTLVFFLSGSGVKAVADMLVDKIELTSLDLGVTNMGAGGVYIFFPLNIFRLSVSSPLSVIVLFLQRLERWLLH